MAHTAFARTLAAGRGTMTKDDHAARLDRMDRWARLLDSRFRIPVIGIPVGWDSILGLVPGVGAAVTAVPAGWMIYEGARLGARKRVLARMGMNAGVDVLIGGVPVIGDIADVFFKSHRRNMALLNREMRRGG